jgi:hypothetical protein
MVLNTTFNNISVIFWQSVLLVEETGVPWETTDMLQVTDKLGKVVSSPPLYEWHSNSKFFSCIMAKIIYIPLDDDVDCFVLDHIVLAH